MPNLILGALACGASILFGMGMRRWYQARLAALRDWQNLLVYLQEQIAYNLTPLPRLLRDYASSHEGAVSRAFATYPEVGKMTVLDAERWREMTDKVRSLGKSDLAGQSNRLSLALRQAEEWEAQAKRDLERKGNLYAKLSVLVGLVLMVVMM